MNAGPALSNALGWAHLGDSVCAEAPEARQPASWGRICFIKPLPWQQGSTCRALQLTL